jgi:hypothetical protein
MSGRKRFVLALLLLVLVETTASAAAARRFALVIGANRGASGRPVLRYAVSDAEHFAAVLGDLGGVHPGDSRLLHEPKLKDLLEALQGLRGEIEKGRESSARVEVVFYYSGHADEQGLMLGNERLSYRDLRNQTDLLRADVNVTVLDACASGAITRLKGGRRLPAFLLDSAVDTHGYAFLTSSSENESAQESDRIRASYFTYYLISGLRGAADASGDGKITLNEAYQFAFNETLGHTAKSQAGAQHPAYDMKLTGTGELVMTDIRGVSATLVLPEQLEGRFYLLDSEKRLIAELQKPGGRRVELALSPGLYTVYLEGGKQLLAAPFRLEDKQTLTLEKALMVAAKKEPAILRGPSVYDPYGSVLAGRSRVELLVGGIATASGTSTNAPGVIVVRRGGTAAGLAYSYSPREDLSIRLSYSHVFRESLTESGAQGVFIAASDVYAVLFGARYYPLKVRSGPMRPYLWAGLGPYIRRRGESAMDSQGVTASVGSSATFGFQPGGGVDIFLGRRFAVGVFGGYHILPSMERSSRASGNYRGLEVAATLSFLFGKGTRP